MKLAKGLGLAAVATLLATVVGLWSVGAGFARAQDDVAGPARAAAAGPTVEVPALGTGRLGQPPSASSLAGQADYVSPDGRYVKIGPVEISAAVVVTRGPLD
jgi:hypothetical protein